MENVIALPPLPRPPFAGWIEAQCCQCRCIILVQESGCYVPTCTACRRGQAEFEARKLITGLNDLLTGRDVFNVIPQDQRQQLLNTLCIPATAKVAVDEAPAIGPALFVATESIPAELRDEVMDTRSDADEAPEYDADFGGVQQRR